MVFQRDMPRLVGLSVMAKVKLYYCPPNNDIGFNICFPRCHNTKLQLLCNTTNYFTFM